MSRTTETCRLGLWIKKRLDGLAALKSRDSRFGIIGINGNRECSFMIVRIVDHHLGDAKFIQPLPFHRCADESLCIGCHEIDVFGCHSFRCHDEIPFIFTILIVHNDYHFSIPYIFDCLLNGCESFHICHLKNHVPVEIPVSISNHSTNLLVRPYDRASFLRTSQ